MKIHMIYAVIALATFFLGCAGRVPLPKQIPDAMNAACQLYTKAKPEVVKARAYAVAHWNDKVPGSDKDLIPPEVKEALLSFDLLPRHHADGRISVPAIHVRALGPIHLDQPILVRRESRETIIRATLDCGGMTRYLHDDCEHCRHNRIVITSECPNIACRKPITWDYVDVYNGLGKYECPHCGVPLIYTTQNGMPTIEGDAERLEAMTRPPAWKGLDMPERMRYSDAPPRVGRCACGEIKTMAGRLRRDGKDHTLKACTPIV